MRSFLLSIEKLKLQADNTPKLVADKFDNTLSAANTRRSDLEKFVGQLIIGGFRNYTIQKKSNIVKYIQKYNLAGVILYDEDVAIGGTGTRNVKSQSQVKKLIKDIVYIGFIKPWLRGLPPNC